MFSCLRKFANCFLHPEDFYAVSLEDSPFVGCYLEACPFEDCPFEDCPSRVAPLRFALVRIAKLRIAPLRFVLRSFAPLRSGLILGFFFSTDSKPLPLA